MAVSRLRSSGVFGIFSLLTLASALSAGCSASPSDNSQAGEGSIVDVPHTTVERQSIGNCWLYSQATWIESMHLSATGESIDISQSYWTYWHWFDEVQSGDGTEIATGGNQATSNAIVRKYGLVPEASFVPEDASTEMSARQKDALKTMNDELKTGRLSTPEARANKALVRTVLDDAWKLSDDVKGYLTATFGEDGTRTFAADSRSPEGTPIVAPADLAVKYTRRAASGEATEQVTTLSAAISDWRVASYPSYGRTPDALAKSRRDFLKRVQRALHDRQPVVITWNVDFNAMESKPNERRGSFNITTLAEAGRPGSQGGHMTVLEDYEAATVELGVLAAGATVDASTEEGKKKLEAALLDSTTISFLRVKNSWGSLRDDRASAPGFPGYHDLYLDYLNAPIAWCPSVTNATAETCPDSAIPFRNVMLPPGY